jgi:hypothetical protein
MRPLALFVLCLTPAASAQLSARWLNPVSGDWTNPAFWSTAAFPNSPLDDATIDAAGSPYTVTLAVPISLRNLTLNSTAATLDLSGSITLANQFNLQAGTLLGDGGTIRGGTLVTSPAATVHVNTPSGAVGFTLDGVHIQGDLSITDPGALVAVPSGLDIVGSLRLSAGAGLVASGNTTLRGQDLVLGDATTGGSILFADGASIDLAPGTTIRGGGDVGIPYPPSLPNPAAAFTIDGSLLGENVSRPLWVHPRGPILNGSTGTIRADRGTVILGDAAAPDSFTNEGLIQAVDGGTVRISSRNITNVNAAGNTLTDGQWFALTGSTIAFDQTAHITTNNANVVLSGGNSFFPPIDSIAFNQGAFSVYLERSFTTQGSLTNSGIITIGVESSIHVAGDYVQTGVGRTVFILNPGGLASAILTVNGDADLDGIISIRIDEPNSFHLGQEITILTASAVTGEFSTLDLPPLANDLALAVAYTPSSVVIQIVPAPGALALGLLLTACTGRRKRAAHSPAPARAAARS